LTLSPVHRDAEGVGAVEHLHRERLVELPEVDVVDRQAQPLQHLRHGVDRADAHLVGLAPGDGEAEEAAERLHAALLGERLVDQDAGAGPVGELARVAGRDHAAGTAGRMSLIPS
jgi:hypothetical protein